MIKEFNTYLATIDYDFWYRLCDEYGEIKSIRKGEEFISIGKIARCIGLIKSGSVKYVAYTSEGDERIVGLETVGGFAASWPYCLHGLPSVVSIIANSDSDICCLDVSVINRLTTDNIEMMWQIAHATEQVFYTAYDRVIGFYTQTPKERYEAMIRKCPKIFEVFDLKDIAAFLNITPVHLSRIRKG